MDIELDCGVIERVELRKSPNLLDTQGTKYAVGPG